MAAPSGKLGCHPSPQASSRLPRLPGSRLRMESWLPNWQNRAMSSGGASGFGGFIRLALRQAHSAASPWPVPSLQFRPSGQALRMLRSLSLRHQNSGQAQVRWNPSHSTKPRAITMGSTGRGVSYGPASPGWLSGRAG